MVLQQPLFHRSCLAGMAPRAQQKCGLFSCFGQALPDNTENQIRESQKYDAHGNKLSHSYPSDINLVPQFSAPMGCQPFSKLRTSFLSVETLELVAVWAQHLQVL